ncbi:MAG: SpoIVB peptidase S55 domain-containing protein [Phycisphaerae bacterium]
MNPFKYVFVLSVLVLSAAVPFAAGESDFVLDTSRYIPLDEVRPGMQAYCLTVYEGTEVERFELEVLSVIKNIRPGRNAIMVMGKDERFIHSGPVAGCSGSPVYIDGRIAGALAFGWTLSKDPLYGVTPIEEMIRPALDKGARASQERFLAVDYSKPIDLTQIYQQLDEWGLGKSNNYDNTLPAVLLSSGLSPSAGQSVNKLADAMGLFAAPSGGAGSVYTGDIPPLGPGSALALPLLTGDIRISAVGTVTDVVGDDVYAFGHSFLGYGAVDLPMGRAKVHTVVSSIMRSFKLSSPLDIIGAVRFDEATVVRGKIGEQARLIPIEITVDRYNDPKQRIYKCLSADNQYLTPLLLRIALNGAAYQYGDLPLEHSIRYKVDIRFDGTKSISFENVSTDSEIMEAMVESTAPVSMLMNNPFRPVRIDSIHCEIQQTDKSLASQIWALNLSNSRVRPGEKLRVEVILESMRSQKKNYQFEIEIPQNINKDKYEIIVCGRDGYLEFLRNAAIQRFIAQDIDSLTQALNQILNTRRDRLYCILILPKGGIALDREELPDLPATKSLVLMDSKRLMNVTAYQHWIEQSIPIDTVVAEAQKVEITVVE